MDTAVVNAGSWSWYGFATWVEFAGCWLSGDGTVAGDNCGTWCLFLGSGWQCECCEGGQLAVCLSDEVGLGEYRGSAGRQAAVAGTVWRFLKQSRHQEGGVSFSCQTEEFL
jgi:hypothetical protein